MWFQFSGGSGMVLVCLVGGVRCVMVQFGGFWFSVPAVWLAVICYLCWRLPGLQFVVDCVCCVDLVVVLFGGV